MLVNQMCTILKSTPSQIQDGQKVMNNFVLLLKFLKKRKVVRTTHLKTNKTVRVFGLTLKGADEIHAYQGFLKVTVQQHFYARHKIRLMFPKLPCVVEKLPNGHKNYYPMEVLKL